MELTVAKITSAQGLKGEVKLDVRTDQPEVRFRSGNILQTNSDQYPLLTVSRMRVYKGSTYCLFEEITDRTQAENARGVELVIESENEPEEEEGWYAHELRGLEVLDTDGYTLGEVVDLEIGVAQDLLVIKEIGGVITRVPFVEAIVKEVDLEDNCVVVDAPHGLFSFDDDVEE